MIKVTLVCHQTSNKDPVFFSCIQIRASEIQAWSTPSQQIASQEESAQQPDTSLHYWGRIFFVWSHEMYSMKQCQIPQRLYAAALPLNTCWWCVSHYTTAIFPMLLQTKIMPLLGSPLINSCTPPYSHSKFWDATTIFRTIGMWFWDASPIAFSKTSSFPAVISTNMPP